MNKESRDWGNLKTAKILVIGHDPRLKQSDTIAEYCFFADYYLKQNITGNVDRRKKGLASSVFNLVSDLTNNKFSPDEIYITNLCNEVLPHAKQGKTVYIPENKAKDGIKRIENILSSSNIEYVFATSLQVNYWLQKLGFYSSNNKFLLDTQPKEDAIDSGYPYFEVNKKGTFKQICGNIYSINNYNAKIIPILHPKQYPLSTVMKGHYGESYEYIKTYFK